MGGVFKCRHLPFYINDPILNEYDRYKYYLKSKYSTMGKLYNIHINNFIVHTINDKVILLDKKINKNINDYNNIISVLQRDERIIREMEWQKKIMV